jgi:Cu2+-exporting ATPase
MFRSLLLGSLLLTLPALAWTDMIQDWLGFRAPRFPGSQYIPAIFGTAVFVYAGRVFLQGAVRELRDHRPGMMTLIALAISVAFVFSVAVTLGFPGMSLWWELATLVTIMVLGHWLEMRSITQARGAIRELAALLPATATRVVNEHTEEVPLSELRPGDVILVRPGAHIPADATVQDGQSEVNESMITGESRPVDKTTGDSIIAGTVNGSGSLRAAVTGTGEHTALSGIMRLVQQAQESRSRAQALADRAAFALTIVAIASAVITLIAWLFTGAGAAFTVERVVTVLVIACPHALGLAIPLVLAISTTLGAKTGILVRDRRGLEDARNVDTVVFDKTGTLTLGEFRVTAIKAEGLSDNEALRIAAAVETDSEHTIARAIVKEAETRVIAVPRAQDFRAIPGHGAYGRVDGSEWHVGGPALVKMLNARIPEALEQAVRMASEKGHTVIYLVGDGRARAMFAVADAVRPEASEGVQLLKRAGTDVVMLTGDAQAVAQSVARDIGIDHVIAGVLPDQKADTINQLRRDGRNVAMVGDGVNDAPALLSANVGIAIGGGTQVAVEAGDIVLVRNDPRAVAHTIELSRISYRKMVQNLWWAAGYNIIAIPLAAGVLAPWGIVLHPAVGAVLMSASTIIVALNAQLLRRARKRIHSP